MKNIILIFSIAILNSGLLFSQFGWEQIPLHGAYRFDNSFHETMHMQPGGIEFFGDTTYQSGSQLNSSFVQINSKTEDVVIERNHITFSKNQGGGFVNRIKLDYDGLSMANGGSWTSFNLSGTNDGELSLYNGSGSLNVYVGNTKVKKFGNVSHGAVYVYDNTSMLQAGMYVNSLSQGVLFADIKNFRIPHPEKSNKEIWYASLEGPEAGAYDRGTSTLVNGEVFIPFEEHFMHVVNPETMTVQLTPQHWDTYGLAVVTKSKNGFYVKELKGGKGNFSFDWEVKCIRSGYEDFKAIRDTADLPQPVLTGTNKHLGIMKEISKKSHGSHENHDCALHRRKK